MKVIEQLSLTEVDDVVSDGDSFKITLRVLGATTVHLLKMPSAKDVFEYRPSSTMYRAVAPSALRSPGGPR